MLDTFQAVAVFVVALLPGALYTWAFERIAGDWGISLSDRLYRFVGASALFHTLAAPATYWLYSEYVSSGRLADGGPVSWLLWLAPIVYVAIPTAVGTAIGRATRDGHEWAKLFTGPNPAPRAWDHLFGSEPTGWIRLRLRSGTWLAGAYAHEGGRRSYAAGYPEPQDLYLTEAIEADPSTGRFLRDETGRVIRRGSGILIRWDEVEYLEFVEG